MASPDQPLQCPEPDTLFGLDGFLDDMIDRGASVAFVPTCYIEADATASLNAIQEAACDVERHDVVVVVALDVTWLRDGALDGLYVASGIAGVGAARVVRYIWP